MAVSPPVDRPVAPPALRAALVFAGVAMLAGTVALAFQWEWATDLWPWPDTRFSYLFLASILAAIAAPTIWIGLSGELGAIEAGAIDLTITYVGGLAYLLTVIGDPGQPELGAYVAVFGVAALSTIAVLVAARRVGVRDPRPMPVGLRVAFGLLAAVLIAAGVALVAHEAIFPWTLSAESSAMFGLIFLGAAAYFVHGLVYPSWANATGQLIGFLAYDVVLIGPFVGRIGDVEGTQLASLLIYLAVLVASAALAVHYLLIDRRTRLIGR